MRTDESSSEGPRRRTPPTRGVAHVLRGCCSGRREAPWAQRLPAGRRTVAFVGVALCLVGLLPALSCAATSPARFCILDDEQATGEEFLRRAKMLQEQMQIHRDHGAVLQAFFAYGRDRGAPALPGLKRRKSSCPRFPLLKHADWACWLRRKNGMLNLTKPFNEVNTIWLNQETAWAPLYDGELDEERLTLESGWLREGFRNFTRCVKGCDCTTNINDQPTLCKVNDLVRILNANEAEYVHKKGNITLIVAGHDNPKLHIVMEQAREWVKSGWFRRIFYEGVTRNVTGIDTYLKVLDHHYMAGRERHFLDAVVSADLSSKPYLALGSWGKRDGSTEHLQDSHSLNKFIDGVHARFDGDVSKGRNTTSEPWIQRKMFNVTDYFRQLSRYKFLVAPKGGGLQSPKFLEALMVMTIPVTKRYTCFEDLQHYGMPMVVVDSWKDLTPKLLRRAWEHYRPVLERARWIGTIQGVESLYYGRCTDA